MQLPAITMKDDSSEMELDSPEQPVSPSGVVSRTRRAGPAAMALVIGLAALTAQASESDLVRDIQRYCTVCWRNARLDPTLWDDCTQEVCCRLLTKARAGELELAQVLADDTPERRELVRAIDMVRKRVQRAKRHQAIDSTSIAGTDHDSRHRDRLELGEILEAARRAVLSPRQDRIALRKLEHHLRSRCEELGIGPVAVSALAQAQRPVLFQAVCSRGTKAGGSTAQKPGALDLVD